MQFSLPIKPLTLLLYNLHGLEDLDLGKTQLTDDDIKCFEGVTLRDLKHLRICLVVENKEVVDILKLGSSKVLVHAATFHVTNVYNQNLVYNRNLTWNYLFHKFGRQILPYSDSELEPLFLCCLNWHQINFDKFLNCGRYTFIDCNIDDEAVAIMTEKLLTSRKPKQLRFDVNKITGEGAAHLANLLKVSPEIEVFSAFGNYIDNGGAIALANSLKHCEALHNLDLDLQCNNIGDEGAIALVKATTTKKYVRLYLWNQSITKGNYKNLKLPK